MRLFVLCVLVAGCSLQEPSERSVFEVAVGSERFRIELATAAQVREAEAALAADRTGVVLGTLARGDGGVNAPYTWHLVPESIAFPDFAVEVCDGRPRADVEADLAYWVDTVGTFCPWSARLVARVE